MPITFFMEIADQILILTSSVKQPGLFEFILEEGIYCLDIVGYLTEQGWFRNMVF